MPVTLTTDVKPEDLTIDGKPCCKRCFASVLANPDEAEAAPKAAYVNKVFAAIRAREKEVTPDLKTPKPKGKRWQT